MTYTVIWVPSAQRELAALCVQYFHHGLGAISAAVTVIDNQLKQDPHTKGVPLYDVVRTFGAPPLNVDFEVDDADMKVYILTVWHD
jgi:hypothetical protein